MSEASSRNINVDKRILREGGERFNILSAGAQDLRYFPSLGEGIVQKSHDDINELYKHDSHRHWEADFYIARSIRSMVWGSLAHVMYSRLLSKLLPYLEQDDLLGGVTDMPLTSDFYKTPLITTFSLTEAQESFMRAGSALLLGTSEALFREIDEDPNHFYKPLIQQVERVHKHYKKKRMEREQKRRAISSSYVSSKLPPADHWQELWHEGMVDNLGSAYQAIKMRQQARRDTDIYELGRIALSDIEKFKWLTSINANILKVVGSEDHRYGGMKETGPADNPACSFVHPSLQDGPWRVRYFCAGQYVLRSPFPVEQLEASRFFKYIGLACDQGAFDTSLALLAISKKLSDEITLNHKRDRSNL